MDLLNRRQLLRFAAGAVIAEETEKWAKVVKLSGLIKAD